MKIVNLFCSITLVSLLVIAYSSITIGDNHVMKRYTVKINGIPFRNDVATNILSRIKNSNDNAIRVYDNVQKQEFMLSNIEENMDVTIPDNEFLPVVSDLYKNLLEGKNINYEYYTMGKMSCENCNITFNTVPSEVDMCIDDNKQVSHFAIK
jgi:hypothetical protein